MAIAQSEHPTPHLTRSPHTRSPHTRSPQALPTLEELVAMDKAKLVC
ncbi:MULTISPECIES: hypothetical protein [Moorena]|uniref:Uncharacterized protein n=1 Tax=Moorena producens (strain JHB) TaxID=1454205 RepID=A0A9Q9UVF2_MOOP1|nr:MULTISPECIES: hypothetical protein [Moorena]NEQ14860.1 hypothetical protein [Moorena sp. SIO3E2]NEP32756.1 hypothetical protein [Moorena sp. SIO3B2]NEP64480.1 hypothetical protein [Moorena sp. SIO3A5]NEQ11717.1 hypothetical protein [Moorena sp. SIO4E2]NER87645.1 hypothetical protein [Moorena sp. SIO3A2]